ncbi:hypothetical protein ACFL4F_03500 [Candidatus Margulisiibacteriota bacterium]
MKKFIYALLFLLVLCNFAYCLNIFGIEKGKTNFKKVVVNKGDVTFSFEIPKTWLVETRHSKKTPSIEHMREFLLTHKRGHKLGDDYLSDYCDYPLKKLQDLSDEEIIELYTKKYYVHLSRTGYPPQHYPYYPNASVAPGNADIMYGDMSWDQIDLYVLDVDMYTIDYAEGDVKMVTSYYFDKAVSYVTSHIDELMASTRAIKVSNSIGEDEDGRPLATRERSGGILLFIAIPRTDKTLLIKKQARMGQEFEDGYNHLIETLRFE